MSPVDPLLFPKDGFTLDAAHCIDLDSEGFLKWVGECIR
jgi:hypothetical protein